MEFETFDIPSEPVKKTEWTWSESNWILIHDSIAEDVYWMNRKTGERIQYVGGEEPK